MSIQPCRVQSGDAAEIDVGAGRLVKTSKLERRDSILLVSQQFGSGLRTLSDSDARLDYTGLSP